jgi:hypothetical protein
MYREKKESCDVRSEERGPDRLCQPTFQWRLSIQGVPPELQCGNAVGLHPPGI